MNRKALIKQYKETQRPMGVYRVRNTINGKSFIGSTVNLPAIFNRHRFQLKLGSHPCRPLQQDWNEFGEDAFQFEVLDTLEPREEPDYSPAEDLRLLEELWLQKMSAAEGPGYNQQPSSP